LQGGILKEFFCRGKTKLAYFAGGKNLFTHDSILLIKNPRLNQLTHYLKLTITQKIIDY
jgi:hypothetical protein